MYTIEEHRHRFAAWAASRAASVKGCRFEVETGKQLLENIGLNKLGGHVLNLPSPDSFDLFHREWRIKLINEAQTVNLPFTHGVAAKLINVYLKALYIGNDTDNQKIKAIHPPIDSVLLEALYTGNIGGAKKEWNSARKVRWSKLSMQEYEQLIATIRKVLPEHIGLWTIEEYWQGYQ